MAQATLGTLLRIPEWLVALQGMAARRAVCCRTQDKAVPAWGARPGLCPSIRQDMPEIMTILAP